MGGSCVTMSIAEQRRSKIWMCTSNEPKAGSVMAVKFTDLRLQSWRVPCKCLCVILSWCCCFVIVCPCTRRMMFLAGSCFFVSRSSVLCMHSDIASNEKPSVGAAFATDAKRCIQERWGEASNT